MSQSARASPGAGRNARWREMRRSELVTVPSFSAHAQRARRVDTNDPTLTVDEVNRRVDYSLRYALAFVPPVVCLLLGIIVGHVSDVQAGEARDGLVELALVDLQRRVALLALVGADVERVDEGRLDLVLREVLAEQDILLSTYRAAVGLIEIPETTQDR